MSASTRRAHSEDNILAMLERDSVRRGTSSRMAWYGTGSALALVLVGALGWLAYDSGALREDQVLTPVAVAPHAPATTMAAEAPRPAEIQPARAATIVDTPPDQVRLAEAAAPPAPQAAAGQPPLVLLSPGQAATIEQAAAAHEAAPKQDAAAATPVRAAAHQAAPKQDADTVAPVRALPRKAGSRRALATAAPPHKHLVARAAPRIRPAAHPTIRLASHSGTAPRLKKAQPAAPHAADAPVDSDVALISAIIGRSNRHAEERSQTRP